MAILNLDEKYLQDLTEQINTVRNTINMHRTDIMNNLINIASLPISIPTADKKYSVKDYGGMTEQQWQEAQLKQAKTMVDVKRKLIDMLMPELLRLGTLKSKQDAEETARKEAEQKAEEEARRKAEEEAAAREDEAEASKEATA